MAVRQLGWHFVGRLRNKNLVLLEETEKWQLSSSFFQQATGRPTHFGHALLTEKEQVPVHIVLYKGKNRHKRNLNKKISASGKSKRYSNAAKDPWVLVTSLPQARDNPVHIVNIYPGTVTGYNFCYTLHLMVELGLNHDEAKGSQCFNQSSSSHL